MSNERIGTKTKGRNPLLAITALTIVSALVIVGFSGCTSQQQTNLIRIDGAYALQPLMIKWTDEYHKLHSNVTFDVQAHGAGTGMSLLFANQIDLSMLSRAINNSEVSQGGVYVSVARDAVFPTISSDNPVYAELVEKGITNTTLKYIFITGNITKWGQVVGTNNTSPIDVYTRSDPGCGAADTFAKFLGKNYKQGDLAAHANASQNGDMLMAAAIASNPNALGYTNMAYIYDANGGFQGNIRPIPLDLNHNGTIDAKENFYTNHTALANAINTGFLPAPPARVENLAVLHNFTGATKTFVLWILNASGGQQYIASNGYVTLPANTIQQQITYIETGVRPS